MQSPKISASKAKQAQTLCPLAMQKYQVDQIIPGCMLEKIGEWFTVNLMRMSVQRVFPKIDDSGTGFQLNHLSLKVN